MDLLTVNFILLGILLAFVVLLAFSTGIYFTLLAKRPNNKKTKLFDDGDRSLEWIKKNPLEALENIFNLLKGDTFAINYTLIMNQFKLALDELKKSIIHRHGRVGDLTKEDFEELLDGLESWQMVTINELDRAYKQFYNVENYPSLVYLTFIWIVRNTEYIPPRGAKRQ